MENVSHNTSYSDFSPNVKEEDEEFVEDQECIKVPPRIRFSPHQPNLSQSEIEEMNYTQSPVVVMGQRIAQMEGIWKIERMIHRREIKRLQEEIAFNKIKISQNGNNRGEGSFSITEGGLVARIIDSSNAVSASRNIYANTFIAE